MKNSTKCSNCNRAVRPEDTSAVDLMTGACLCVPCLMDLEYGKTGRRETVRRVYTDRIMHALRLEEIGGPE